jgi:hypothetical protein
MSSPKSKCVSLGTAKKLKEAGFPQDTERWWALPRGGNKIVPHLVNYHSTRIGEIYAAPDAQEIAEQLPFRAKWDIAGQWSNDWLPHEMFMPTLKHRKWFRFCYMGDNDVVLGGMWFEHENEAEARAACWLWLREQKLI